MRHRCRHMVSPPILKRFPPDNLKILFLFAFLKLHNAVSRYEQHIFPFVHAAENLVRSNDWCPSEPASLIFAIPYLITYLVLALFFLKPLPVGEGIGTPRLVCACVCVYIWSCVFTWRSEVDTGRLPQLLSTLSFETVSLSEPKAHPLG